MTRTLVIAEPGMTWDRDLDKAYRLIDAAKACDADIVKFQWTSSGRKIQQRRQVDEKYIAIYERGVQYPREWLFDLMTHCDEVGITFMCTTYLPEDIAVVDPLVKMFKVSAYESEWREFIEAHPHGKNILVSTNPKQTMYYLPGVRFLHCVSKYPTPIEDLKLRQYIGDDIEGFSDHTANVLTGAAAVAAGATIVEAHIRLHDTDKGNPDYGHSLVCDWVGGSHDAGNLSNFGLYVGFIRTVERML